jgi:hypothetical protein
LGTVVVDAGGGGSGAVVGVELKAVEPVDAGGGADVDVVAACPAVVAEVADFGEPAEVDARPAHPAANRATMAASPTIPAKRAGGRGRAVITSRTTHRPPPGRSGRPAASVSSGRWVP